MDYLFLLVGFVALIIGGDLLVKGAVGLALKAGISALTIGLTIVSFGTSAPELLVSVKSALQPATNGENLMSVGNIVGSNIANLSLVLGVTVLIYPVIIQKMSLYRDWPVLMVATLLASFFMADLEVTRIEGVILFSGLIVFTFLLLWRSNKNKADDLPDEVATEFKEPKPVALNLLFIFLGIGGLAFGSDWLVESASNIARSYGVSPFVIGVTVLAFGTSVPELATSAIAAYRKETDLAVGNLIGSNIFNILSVLGVTALITPVPLTQAIFKWDVIWMILIAVLLFGLMIIQRKLTRWMGVILIVIYLTYIGFLVISKGA